MSRDALSQLSGGRVAVYHLPDPLRRVVERSARLARLLDLDAPRVVLEFNRRLVAEAYLELGAYLNEEVLVPAVDKCEASFVAENRAEIVAHLQEHHNHTAPADATFEVLYALHDTLDHSDHDKDLWSNDHG
jgi:hypothetical protein